MTLSVIERRQSGFVSSLCCLSLRRLFCCYAGKTVLSVFSFGKSRVQRAAVYYCFVGYIEIPELPKHRHNVKADTRQGVSVEYVPQIATA